MGIGTRMTLVTVLAAVVGVRGRCSRCSAFENLGDEPVWAVYGFVITGFIFMRFVLAWLYRPRRTVVTGYRPTVAIIVPAYNEPDIAKTLVGLPDRGLPQGADPGGGGRRQVHRRAHCGGSTRSPRNTPS